MDITACPIILMKLIITFIAVLWLIYAVSAAVTTPINAQGTTLPPLTATSPYRVFNDLMKQSDQFYPYIVQWGSLGRCWNGCTVNYLPTMYPANLVNGTNTTTPLIAQAQINLFPGIDDALLNQNVTLTFSGSGMVGLSQSTFNTTWSSGAGGNFIIKSLTLPLSVTIYSTDPTNPVNGITILPTNLVNPTTFTSNFIKYLKPFNLLRTCYWQGQNLYNSGISKQIWSNRALITSASQITPWDITKSGTLSKGVALEHILQLQKEAGVTIWPCIPDTADTDYVKNMGTLFNSIRDTSKIMYLEYGNVYTIMNNFPDAITTPVFDTFMEGYGRTLRSSILFTINYKDTQFYLNAMGMGQRNPPVNFTYIDAIGIEASFGIIDALQGSGLSDTALKALIVNYQLTYETIVNRAYQFAASNGTALICWSGGPYLKTPQFGWNWRYNYNIEGGKNNATVKDLANKETILYNTLLVMTQTDSWVGELYLHWQARLTSLGVKTIMYSQFVGDYKTDSVFVPILAGLKTTTIAWTTLNQAAFNGRKTILPTAGVVPANPFICSPSCKWGDCVNNVCSCYAGYSGSDCNVYTAPNVQNKIGMNLQGISYWTTQHPFTDLHREGSAWVYGIVGKGWSSGAAFANQVPLDTNGYPTYLPPGIQVSSLMARDVLTHYDNGTYVILYDGDGILTFGIFDMKAVRYGIGRIQVDVIPSTNFNNGLLFIIERTNPDNYIRNIRVIRPGFEGIWQAVNFSPLLLNKLQPYGTLRFMDWTNTNAQTDAKWTDRTTTTARTYTKNGVAWEQIIRLGNTLGKNIWITIPHLADDDYITQLATLVFNTLEPHLTVYVEYSNELWGGQFPGGQYAQAQGILKGYSTDPTQARFCFLGQRTNEISAIWRGVFASNSARLQMIVSTQSVNADTTKRILACKNTQNYVDAVAIAPYLSIPLNDSMTFANVFTGMNNKLTGVAKDIQSHLQYTNSFNLKLFCYEAGQGLTGSSSVQTALQIGVQTSTDMATLYFDYLNMLFNNSIQLALHFTDSGLYTVYGSWGLFRYTDQVPSASQKWLGMSNYLSSQNLNTGVLLYGSCTNGCNGNGICSFELCACYADYGGSDCSVAKFVDYVDCSYLCTFNQGTCGLSSTVGNVRTYTCTCFPGYGGPYCSLPICSGNCNYNGICTAANVCTCFRGKTGSNCQTDCGCGGHGTCNTTDNTCICDDGFNFNPTTKKCQFKCLDKPSTQCYGPNLLNCNGCQSGTCNNGTCTCWPGYSGVNCSVEVDITYKNSNLGINVGGLAYWSTQHLFKDYFKQSSVWIPQYCPGCVRSNVQYTWNTNLSFPKQANGYPSSLAANQSVGKLLLRDLQLRYPSISTTNEYVLLYSGDGIIKLGMDAKTTSVSAGRITFTVTPSTVRDNGIYVQLILTNPSNPVNNIRVILASDQYNYNNDIITASFLPFIQQFSTIRYMDLLGTNGSPVKEWNQTTSSDMDTQAQLSGISIELVAKITSRTGRNIWFNVPHLASNDYVTKLANYLKTNISPKRIIYVEYSNQVWNTFFAQGKYAVAQATSLGLANYHKFYANRSLQIFNIFSSVFGTNSPRLKFVISYQAVSQWVADQILSYPGLLSVVNVIASAPYYDCNNIGNTTNVGFIAAQPDEDAVIQKCKNTTSWSSLNAVLGVGLGVSGNYPNIATAAYEAGTAISQTQTIYNGAETPTATKNFIAANRNSSMYGIYKDLLNNYKKTGNLATNAPLMLFSGIGLPSKYGSWGILDYSDQVYQTPTHPKFQAVIDFNLGL